MNTLTRLSAALLIALCPLLLAQTTPGVRFTTARPGKQFTFPRDHGSHPDFRIEWWYITGHLFTADKSRYGFQATFFRRASEIPPDAKEAPEFSSGQLYLAHMALLDVKTGRFIHQERINRGGWDAQASEQTLDVRNGNWSLRFAGAGQPPDTMLLEGSIRGEAAFTLTLTPQKPLVIFGKDGVSRKGAEETAASHYLTWPRLAVSGSLRTGEASVPVTGSAWMDHEMSSSQLSEGQAGWDWASLQLDDGRDVMAYRMRRTDGTTDPYSTLAWISREGAVQHVAPPAFRWEVTGTWKSPASGANYPVRVRISAPDPVTGQEVSWQLEPLAENQELTGALGGVTYWEGACRVLNSDGVECGRAFLELTGHAGDLSRQLK